MRSPFTPTPATAATVTHINPSVPISKTAAPTWEVVLLLGASVPERKAGPTAPFSRKRTAEASLRTLDTALGRLGDAPTPKLDG